MAKALRPLGHEDRLSLVDHLDELRKRLFISVIAFGVCFGLCLWQNSFALDIINEPLRESQLRTGNSSPDPLEQSTIFQRRQGELARVSQQFAQALAREPAISPATRELARDFARASQAVAATTPRGSPRRPVTLGIGEPFTATLTVAAYGGFLLALPLLLYQAYAFVLPAFSPREKQVALPLMLSVPFLFIAGVVFAYLFVLPSAVNFLQNFNDDEFDILLQARDYYRFAVLVLMVMGFLFQIPVGILAVTRLGIVTPKQLRAGRRYAILVIAVMAMLLPGTDPVTMLLAMGPLVVLYEGSILLASLLDRRAAKQRAREEAELAAEEDEDQDDLFAPYRDDREDH